MTANPLIFDIVEISSSVIPSAKYSSLGTGLILEKGKTAMRFFSNAISSTGCFSSILDSPGFVLGSSRTTWSSCNLTNVLANSFLSALAVFQKSLFAGTSRIEKMIVSDSVLPRGQSLDASDCELAGSVSHSSV